MDRIIEYIYTKINEIRDSKSLSASQKIVAYNILIDIQAFARLQERRTDDAEIH